MKGLLTGVLILISDMITDVVIQKKKFELAMCFHQDFRSREKVNRTRTRLVQVGDWSNQGRHDKQQHGGQNGPNQLSNLKSSIKKKKTHKKGPRRELMKNALI